MPYQRIVEDPAYKSLSLEQRGAVLGACLYNIASGGEAYTPEDSAEEVILQELSLDECVVLQQMDMSSFSIGFVVRWASEYLDACKGAGIVHGESEGRSASLVERSRVRASDIGYRSLDGEYQGYLPTSRHDSIGQVFVVTEEFVSRLKVTLSQDDVLPYIAEYYDLLMVDPKKRPSAKNMPSSLIKFIRRRAGKAKGVEYVVMGVLDAE